MPHCSFSKSGEHRHLHSFPTRRSSDLIANLIRGLAPEAVIVGGPIVRSWPVIADDIKTSVEATICRGLRSEEHTSELQSRLHLVCRLLLEKKNKQKRA